MEMPGHEYIEKENIQLIEINIKKIGQLFNSFDPSPFLEKDLDDDAFEYIYSSVAEHPLSVRQKIIIHIPKHQQRSISELEIRRAIHHFFDYKREWADKNIRMKLREGQFSFIVGTSFLTCSLLLANWIAGNYDSLVSNIISEGLIIGGWVAMWKPISNMLYDWWPLRKEHRIFDKISKMEIQVRFI